MNWNLFARRWIVGCHFLLKEVEGPEAKPAVRAKFDSSLHNTARTVWGQRTIAAEWRLLFGAVRAMRLREHASKPTAERRTIQTGNTPLTESFLAQFAGRRQCETESNTAVTAAAVVARACKAHHSCALDRSRTIGTNGAHTVSMTANGAHCGI